MGSKATFNHADRLIDIQIVLLSVLIDPTHVIVAERGRVKVNCKGINFFRPTYTWLKNGKHIHVKSGLSLHIYSNVLFLPFAYNASSGNYTCVVKDSWGTATASTIIRVYKGNFFHLE